MDWIAQARKTPLARRPMRALASLVPSDVGPALHEAVGSRSGDLFPQLLLSALAAEREVDAGVLVEGLALLPDAGVMAAAAGHCAGDVVGALLAAVEAGRLGWDLEAVALVLAAFVGRRQGLEDPTSLTLCARRLARKAPGGLADASLVALLGLADDAALEAALGPVHDQVRIEATELAEGLAACMLGHPLDCLPETVGSRHYSGQPMRRAADKVGRNAACPCGSGKKYKACCMRTDQARQADASEVAGVTRAELAAQPEQHLSLERLEGMLGWELARLDPRRLAPEMRQPWLERLCFFRDYPVLIQAYDALADPALDPLIASHAADAAWNGEEDAARALLACCHEPIAQVPVWAQVALAESPQSAVAVVEAHLGEDVDGLPIEAAYALLRSPWPHLGIWFCRALLPWAVPEDAEPLIGELQDTRERLGYAPWDPVEEVLYTLQHGHDPETARALHEAQEALRANEVRMHGTTAELRSLREALVAKEATLMPEPTLRGDQPRYQPDPAADALRQRIHSLKSELKQRHDERNALRRELRRVSEAAPVPVALPEPVEEDEDPGFEPLDPSTARLRLPVFPDAFQDALKKVPEATGRQAVEKLAAIAVGREGSFHGTRRLRGRPWLLRARIGRSYRLLFRMDDQRVEALDLVHRQDLEKRIRQLEQG